MIVFIDCICYLVPVTGRLDETFAAQKGRLKFDFRSGQTKPIKIGFRVFPT